MKQANLKKIIEGISDFPTLPSIVAHVMQVLDNPYSSAADLTEIVSHDQAMMFRILKMANSAYYGFPRAIATVTESIVLLGFSTVRNLILTTMMYNFDQMWMKSPSRKKPEDKNTFNLWQEWRHSVATAIAARELQHQLHHESAEHLGYLAGLMHDIGKILFYHYLSDEYQQVIEKIQHQQGSASDLEKNIMGASHGQVGAWLVDRWNLPKDIAAPIAFHHAPGKAKDNQELAKVLAHADWLAHAALDSEEPPAGPVVLKELNEESSGKIREKIQIELKHIESFMVV